MKPLILTAISLTALLFPTAKPAGSIPDRPTLDVEQVKPVAKLPQLKAHKAAQLAPEPEPKPKPAPTPTPSPEPPTNGYMAYIFEHESSNNPTARNPEGCLGLGQACPASKLLAVCPGLSVACQQQFFTDYANARYGGWAGAYRFWLANHWW